MNNHYDKYLKYKKKYLSLKRNKVQDGGSDETYYGEDNNKKIDETKPTIYLFKASWCGHCKNFRETWNALANKYEKQMNFILYDSDKNKKDLREWKVSSFPTIILRKNKNATEYQGDRDINNLIPYIDNFIGN